LLILPQKEQFIRSIDENIRADFSINNKKKANFFACNMQIFLLFL